MQSYWEEERGSREGKGAKQWLEHVLNGKRKEEEYDVVRLATPLHFHTQDDSNENTS